MQAFVFNLRKDIFSDIRVRKALNYAFDFEWTNKNLFFDEYKRTDSFYINSIYASHDLPNAAEKQILLPLKSQIPATIFTNKFTLPKTTGSGNDRKNLIIAQDLLKDAGFYIKNMQ